MVLVQGVSPAAYPHLRQGSTRFGKFERVRVNRLSNERATKTLKDTTTLPTHVKSGSSYIRQNFTAAEKLGDGARGTVYMVNSGNDIAKVFNRLTNTIVLKKPVKISTKKIVVKVMSMKDNDRRLWTDPSLQHTRYLEHLTRKTIRAQLKNQPYTDEIFFMQHDVTVRNFNSQPKERQDMLIDAFAQRTRKDVWKTFLQNAALDASNHEYLMKAKPIELKCLHGGELTLRARDYIPELYFAGSDIDLGVYVVAMSAENGTIKRLENFTSSNVAMLERAVLTLAAVGIEHGDLHRRNILLFDNTVKIIDFDLSAILPEHFRKKAVSAVQNAVRQLLSTKSWPEEVTNSIWYGNDGTLRYLDSYMAEKHIHKFDWYSPSGKLLKLVKALSDKKALDAARYKLWTGLCVQKESIINLTSSPNSNKKASRKRQKYNLS